MMMEARQVPTDNFCSAVDDTVHIYQQQRSGVKGSGDFHLAVRRYRMSSPVGTFLCPGPHDAASAVNKSLSTLHQSQSVH